MRIAANTIHREDYNVSKTHPNLIKGAKKHLIY